jgi:hypothetical protein
MRRRLRNFFPIVQIFAPVAACWAASSAASDPLRSAVICHDSAASTPGQTDHTGQSRAHDGCCSFCSMVHAGAPVSTPQTAVAAPYRDPARVAWLQRAPERFGARAGSHAQARAPPPLT